MVRNTLWNKTVDGVRPLNDDIFDVNDRILFKEDIFVEAQGEDKCKIIIGEDDAPNIMLGSDCGKKMAFACKVDCGRTIRKCMWTFRLIRSSICSSAYRATACPRGFHHINDNCFKFKGKV